MGMTIKLAIEELERTKGYPASDPASDEALDFAIDIMHKYQKIEQIVNNAKDSDGAVKYNWLHEQIREVIDDGNHT